MIWFGTERSLYSFDGYDLVQHPCADGNIQINKMLFLQDRLLLATNDGMYSFTPGKEVFRHVTPFREEVVKGLLAVQQYVYVGTQKGLYRYDSEADTAIRLIEGSVFSLSMSGDTVYVGLGDGLGALDLSGGVFTSIPLQVQFFPAACTFAEQESVWIGTPTQLVQLDLKSGKQLHSCSFPVVKSICRAKDGSMMVGTDNGLYRYDPDSGTQEKVLSSVTWVSLEDRLGDLWFGTEDGLQHLQQTSLFRAVEGLPDSGSSQFTSLLRDSQGNLWAGGANGLFCIGDGTLRYYAMSGTPYHIRHNKIRKVVEDPLSADLYVASDGGLLHLDPDSKQMDPIRISDSSNWVYDILPIGKELWAATFDGVFRLGRDGTVLARYTRENGLSSDDIARIARDRTGRIWALTRDQHLFSIEPGSGNVQPFRQASDSFDSICCDGEGRIWAAANNLLTRITPGSDGDDIRTVSLSSDKPTESHAMAEADGRIWICSSNGIHSVGKEELDVLGLSTYRNYVGIAYDSVRGCLLLGSGGRVDEARTEDLLSLYKNASPNILLTGMTVNGSQKIAPDRLLSGHLRLPHDQNHLEVSFTDFNFNEDVPHRFRYRLAGRHESGAGTVSGNRITLSALRPGRYKLAVAPSDSAAEPKEILSFQIRQPWYQSVWMLLFYLGLLGGAIYTIVRLAIMRRYLELERTQRDELVEQSRQKAAFFQDLAHELKTPLSLVIGPIGKAIKEAPPGTDLTDLQIAQENAMNLSTLIHHTIDYYKDTGGVADSPMTSEVEFVDFARTIFDSWRDNHPKHEFIFSSSHPAIPVTIDIVKIETVLNNLLSNACKYTPEGGSVLMTLERDDIGRQLVIKVSDTGIGIPDEEIPFAFQRYFESSRTKQGGYDSTGIGLSVIKKYVEVHGGQVAVDSDANGTTFTVLLPCLAEGAGVGGGSTAGAEDAADTDKPLIAIVDDNAQICNFLESLLKDSYRCVCSHNGKSGLKLCQDVIPDLIISDVRMPVMDGLEMCRQVRQFAPLSTIPIILLTAKDDRETEQQSIDLNIDVFLPKPFEVPTLTARVGQLLGNKKRMEQRIRMEMLTSPGSTRELSQDEKFLRKVTQLIEEHLDDADLSVTRLCELGDFSEKQLYRKLKQFAGQSAVEYIRSIRLKKAALLLQSGNFTVSEVMYSVGFSNASYFTRAFSAAYNMTPSDYMKSFKNK